MHDGMPYDPIQGQGQGSLLSVLDTSCIALQLSCRLSYAVE